MSNPLKYTKYNEIVWQGCPNVAKLLRKSADIIETEAGSSPLRLIYQ